MEPKKCVAICLIGLDGCSGTMQDSSLRYNPCCQLRKSFWCPMSNGPVNDRFGPVTQKGAALSCPFSFDLRAAAFLQTSGDLRYYRKPVFAGGAGGAGLGGDGGVAAGDCLPLSFAESLAGSPCPSIPLLETS